MSVARCQQEVNSREFAEWLAFDMISPGEPERGDYLAALVCSAVINGSFHRPRRSTHPKDCMPRWGKARKRKTPHRRSEYPPTKQVLMKLQAWRAMYEGAKEGSK